MYDKRRKYYGTADKLAIRNEQEYGIRTFKAVAFILFSPSWEPPWFIYIFWITNMFPTELHTLEKCY